MVIGIGQLFKKKRSLKITSRDSVLQQPLSQSQSARGRT